MDKSKKNGYLNDCKFLSLFIIESPTMIIIEKDIKKIVGKYVPFKVVAINKKAKKIEK